VAVTGGELAPESALEHHTAWPIGTRQAQSTAADVAVYRTKAAPLGMLPCRGTDRARRSNSTATLKFPGAEEMVPWRRETLADSIDGPLHEDMSCAARKTPVWHDPRTSMSLVGCTRLAEVLRGTG
jgi:hypothetical protein